MRLKSNKLLRRLLVPIPVPPTRAIILDEKGSIVHGTIGPFNELSTLILTCDVIGGKKLPSNDVIKLSVCAHLSNVLQLSLKDLYVVNILLCYPLLNSWSKI